MGLGNPGKKYDKTRHNAGFWFIDALASNLAAEWSRQNRFHGCTATDFSHSVKLYLLKPETYMNRSGHSVAAIMKYYDIDVHELLVVHDELDFEAGMIKFKHAGGHAGHNGLRDIIAQLGSRDFSRLRIGIGRPMSGAVADYVLSAPSSNDRLGINGAIESVLEHKELLLQGDADRLMNKLH